MSLSLNSNPKTKSTHFNRFVPKIKIKILNFILDAEQNEKNIVLTMIFFFLNTFRVENCPYDLNTYYFPVTNCI